MVIQCCGTTSLISYSIVLYLLTNNTRHPIVLSWFQSQSINHRNVAMDALDHFVCLSIATHAKMNIQLDFACAFVTMSIVPSR